jgi:organic hydroperoxide reductase OsmC/OhrA/nucleotide-binding universal stress UspA family protein
MAGTRVAPLDSEREKPLANPGQAASLKREQLTMKDILVALDGSESASRALALAADVALRYGATLHLVHVTLRPLAYEFARIERVELPIAAAMSSPGQSIVAAGAAVAAAKGVHRRRPRDRGWGEPAPCGAPRGHASTGEIADPEGDMKPLPHRYEVQLTGGVEGYAALTAAGLASLPAAPPLEFDGPGDAWSPEQLLLAAVGSCFLFTLRAVAQASRVDFISLELATEGTVDRHEGILRFTEIVLRPRLLIPAGTDRQRASLLLHRRRSCARLPGSGQVRAFGWCRCPVGQARSVMMSPGGESPRVPRASVPVPSGRCPGTSQ